MNSSNQQIFLSIVSPVYKAEAIVNELVAQIEENVLQLTDNYEIILVEDGSKDNSWQKIVDVCAKNEKVVGVKLSRNFGQHPAIIAGLTKAKGEWVVVMDCDLQDKPSEIPKLLAKAKEGYEIVLAMRINRQDKWLKKLSSSIFASIYGYLSDTKFDKSVANFGIYHQSAVKEIINMGDYIKSFPLFAHWVGFKMAKVEVSHGERAEGESSYSFSKLVSLAFNTIISFSNKPLKLLVKFGIGVSILAVLYGIYIVYQSLTGQITVLGYSSLIISIWLFSGLIITTIGITGIYVGKIFDQTKNRPSFIIQKTLNEG
jgi:dolichol-phosphate mannosyltransferase